MPQDVGYKYYKRTVNGEPVYERLPAIGVHNPEFIELDQATFQKELGERVTSLTERQKKLKAANPNWDGNSAMRLIDPDASNAGYEAYVTGNTPSTKYISELQKVLEESKLANAQSGYEMVNNVPVASKSLREQEFNEAEVAAGRMKKVPIPGGFGYLPVGSAGDQNLVNIGTHNTANAANAPKTNTTTSTTPLPVVELKQGSSGDEVKKLQAIIGATTDGIFGPQTRSKLMTFQQKNGLPVTGIADAATMAVISKGGSTGGGTTTPPKTLKQGEMHPDGSGTVQYDSLTGKPLAAGQTTPSNPADIIASINAKANEEMQKDLALFEEKMGPKVDESDASKIVKTLVKSFEEKNKESTTTEKSFTEKFADKRAELKVDAKEAEMAGIDGEIAKLDAEWKSLQDTEDNRQVSKLQINRRKSEEQILYEKARGELTARKNTIVNELNQKYNVIDSFMKYADMDYDNAEQEYTNRFNQAINLTNLIKGVEDSEKADIERKSDNARANLQVMMTSLKGKQFSGLDSSTKAELAKMELQAGLPTGFTEFALSSVDEPIVTIGSEFTNAGNQRQVPIYTKDPSTGAISVKTITIGSASSSGSGSGGGTEGERKATHYGTINQILALPPERGYVDSSGYITAQGFKDLVNSAIEDNISRKEFLDQYSHKLYPKGGKKYGLSKKEMEDYGILEKE